MIEFIFGDVVKADWQKWVVEDIQKHPERYPTNWNKTTSIDEDGYPYPAITESNENK